MQDNLSSIQSILQPIDKQMSLVNDYIRLSLHSEVDLINQISEHIIESGGKRLRPASVVLSACAANPSKSDILLKHKQATDDYHVSHKLAAVVEFIHTATLLHDDVVDESAKRRGKLTANNVWGNSASVLAGDFLYSRAFQMMSESNSLRIIKILCDTTNKIAEGEVLQLLNIGNVELSEKDYFNTIESKTAVLFAAACQLGAISIGADKAYEQCFQDYGYHLGIAFQLIDDILDYQGDSQSMGKNLGDDLTEGKITLPLLYTLQQCNDSERSQIIKAIEEEDTIDIESVVKIIQRYSGLIDTHTKAKYHIHKANQALASVEDSCYKKSMIDLTNFSLQRTF